MITRLCIGCLLLPALLLAGCESERPPKTVQLRVAVAANFAPTLNELVAAYNEGRETALKIQMLVGSSGLLTAQIISGAPYDLFFAADTERPRKLSESGVIAGEPQTYAIGRLVLWMPEHEYKSARKRLQEGDYERLAIANPELAPYGAAARAVLEELGLWERIQGRVVRGENIGQAYHYVVSGRVDMGFVALSQVMGQQRSAAEEALWQVPTSMYPAIEQQAVVIKGEKQALAEAFLAFCRSKTGREIIQQAGYGLPEE